MKNDITIDNIKDLILDIRNTSVILDSDVARLYGVETRDINKSVANNPDKFPKGYIFQLKKQEKLEVVENFHHLEKLKFSPNLPNAFTEQGLYMLATILKSKQAIQTTLLIINTFTKIRSLKQDFNQILSEADEDKKNKIGAKFGEGLMDLFLDEGLENKESKTKIKFSMFGMSLEKTISKGK